MIKILLKNFRVKNFRNIIDSEIVPVEENITSLVGKNESGKTACLQALRRLNPVENLSFDIQMQYPAWLEKADRLAGKELESVIPICGLFELQEKDKDKIIEQLGYYPIENNDIKVTRRYDGNREIEFKLRAEENLVEKELQEELNDFKIPSDKFSIKNVSDIEELKSYLNKNENDIELSKELKEKLTKFPSDENQLIDSIKNKTKGIIKKLLPKFFYFDEYSSLPGEVDIKRVLNNTWENLNKRERTARSLLKIAHIDEEYILESDYESRKRELENTANAITSQVLDYWSQNDNLRVEIDIEKRIEKKGKNKKAVLDEMKIRLRDERHMLSLPFGERSSGFRWFFSFLSAFSRYRSKEENIIILLDEPALGLHARAQKDFLNYVENELANNNQVIYTTHSPFMIQSDKLNRVRLVEEKNIDEGSKISEDVLTQDRDTLFPLKGALGYNIAQNLFISEYNLVVEGTSDYTYLNIMSNFLEEEDRESLDDIWTIVPVGGVGNIPTFVSLLGDELKVTVLVDSKRGGHQKLRDLAKKGYLNNDKIITIGEFIEEVKGANIEDLFRPDDYLKIYNKTFNTSISNEDLKGSDSIISKIARVQNVNDFNHGKPADIFLRQRDEILSELSEITKQRFEEVFNKINKTL